MAPGQMLAVNSANECPYCTGLHVELGRMAGLGDAAEINTITKSADEIERDAEEERDGEMSHNSRNAHAPICHMC